MTYQTSSGKPDTNRKVEVILIDEIKDDLILSQNREDRRHQRKQINDLLKPYEIVERPIRRYEILSKKGRFVNITHTVNQIEFQYFHHYSPGGVKATINISKTSTGKLQYDLGYTVTREEGNCYGSMVRDILKECFDFILDQIDTFQ